MKRMRHSYGFTLIELMVVMVILSILTVIVSGTFASSSRRGRDSRRKNDIRSITSALEAYYNDYGFYPIGVGGIMTDYKTGAQYTWGGQFKDSNNTLYMVLIPKDPSIYKYYYVSPDGKTFKLYAKLENLQDAGDGVIQDPPGYPGTNCGTGSAVTCTYGISSSNTTP